MVSVVLFWGVSIAILGWLVFKIAERGVERAAMAPRRAVKSAT